jgi:hypothetical protein
VLSGAGLGDDALLAHAPRHQNLAEHIIDLVRTCVIELLALQVNLGAASAARGRGNLPKMLGQTLGEIQGRRPADIVLAIARHVALERGIDPGIGIGLLKIEDQRHQRFRHKAAAEYAEMPAFVGAGPEGVGEGIHFHPSSWPDLFRPSTSCLL